MSAKLIVFDCDGVLRSVPWIGIFEAYKAICKALGIDYALHFSNVEEYKKWYDPDWKINLRKLGIINESIIPALNRIFHKIYDPYTETFLWTNRILYNVSLQQRTAVFSSSLSQSVADSLWEVRDYIMMLVGCDHVKKTKPNPEGLELIMRELGVSPEKTWMIGDTSVDILAGKRAGTQTAIVTWGLSELEEIETLGADKILRNPEEILSLI